MSMSADLQGHRLVILGSMDEFVRLTTLAKERGAYVIVCDGYSDGPAKAIADKSYDIDVRDIDAIVDMCRAELVDGVVSSFSDVLAESLAAVRAKLGMPVYLDPEKLRYLRDKTLMKEMFEELDVPVPRSAVLRAESIHEDLARMTFPAVIKPTDSYGSRGVYLMRDEAQVVDCFADVSCFSSDGCVLCEEYNDGFEFNMMNWVVDGEVVVLNVADREKTQGDALRTPYVSRIVYPSRLVDSVVDEARDIVARVAGYLGMENGPLCMQFFWSEERGIQVCECAGRIFGYEHELLDIAGGPLIEDVLLDSVYDQPAVVRALDGFDAHLPARSAGLYFHGRDGLIASIEGAPSEDDPAIAESLVYYAEGERIDRESGGNKPYAARFYLRADSFDALDRMTEELFRTFRMKDEGGRDLLSENEIGRY